MVVALIARQSRWLKIPMSRIPVVRILSLSVLVALMEAAVVAEVAVLSHAVYLDDLEILKNF
jgi:hypothetical protein